MKYVGLDLHARTSTLAIYDPHVKDKRREMTTRTIRGSLKTVLDEFNRFKEPYQVCYEASTGYGIVYDTLAKSADRVVVAHPNKLRAILHSKQKNDRANAQDLARLLHADFVPTVHVPGIDVRAWRRLIDHRQKLVHKRSATKSALRALLHGLAVEAPKNLWTKKSLARPRCVPSATA